MIEARDADIGKRVVERLFPCRHGAIIQVGHGSLDDLVIVEWDQDKGAEPPLHYGMLPVTLEWEPQPKSAPGAVSR